MANGSSYVRIDGEPFLSRAIAYRDAATGHARAWTEFAKGFGATGYPRHGRGLNFDHGRAPDGWTKPKRPTWHSHPKKGHPDEAVIADMRQRFPSPASADVFGDALCYNLSYETPHGHGSGAIGFFWDGPIIGWAGDIIVAIIPDAEVAVRVHLERSPEDKIVGSAASWRLPEGLTRLTEAEYELLFAQHRVEEERAARLAEVSVTLGTDQTGGEP